MRKQYDMVIKNGSMICFEPDEMMENRNIGICGGKIVEISESHLEGREEIDANGKIISPGFIDFHSHVDGKIFSAQCVALQGGTTTIGGERNFDGSIIRKISEEGFIINHGFYISHSFTLRRAVGLRDPYSTAGKNEIQDMVVLAEKFFQTGTFGIHFGLEFVPGTSEEEIIALAIVAKKYGRVVLVHLRKDGYEAMSGIKEIIDIARKTGAAIHILHLMYMAGFKGIMKKVINEIRAARDEGLDITADTGLYAGFPTCIGSSILDQDWEFYYGKSITKKNLLISSGIYAGEMCDDEKFHYLRGEFPNTLITVFVFEEEEIKTALREEFVFVSTNAADGPHYENIGHPETAGTFPRLICKYVRKEKVLLLLEAIKKITYFPAQRFGIEKKGNIKIGYDADLVIFNDKKVEDKANYVGHGCNPNDPPLGIDIVIVNGETIVKDGKVVNHRNPGHILGTNMKNE